MNRNRLTCPDCSSYLEWWDGYLRCPWTTRTRHRSAKIGEFAAITCNHPYGASRTDIEAPIRGRTTL